MCVCVYIFLFILQPRIHQLYKFGIVNASHKESKKLKKNQFRVLWTWEKIKVIFRIINDNNNNLWSNFKRLDLEKSDWKYNY